MKGGEEMAAKTETNLIGSWAFLIGVVLAIVLGAGLLGSSNIWLIVLVLIGLVVGFLNISGGEVKAFLLSGAVLIIVSSLGKDVMSSIPVLSDILDALLAIFVPATIIVAIKNAFSLVRN